MRVKVLLIFDKGLIIKGQPILGFLEVH